MIDPVSQQTIRVFESLSEASRIMHINSSNISMVCKGQRKKAGGYMWKYSDVSFLDKLGGGKSKSPSQH